MANDQKNSPKLGQGNSAVTVGKKVSILDKIKALANLDLEFIGIAYDKDQDGKMIAILQLAEPIALVRGSQEVEYNGERVPINATDVTELKVHESNFTDEFEFDEETQTGTYKGSSLSLDVSKRGKQVWMVSRKFSAAGNEMRQKGRTDRIAKLLGRAVDETAKPAGTKNPEPVA